MIRNLAAQGPCIIVGRGGGLYPPDLPQVINVFLYADPADKLQYAMDTYGDTREQAARRVRHSDAARESYYHYLTKKKWGDLKNYHLTLNTSPVGKLACAELILQYARQRLWKRGRGPGKKFTATAPKPVLWLSFSEKGEETKKAGETVDFLPGRW